ncbi:MAG: hypothetical protein U0441_17445 [Polyangiaceae bacterium]
MHTHGWKIVALVVGATCAGCGQGTPSGEPASTVTSPVVLSASGAPSASTPPEPVNSVKPPDPANTAAAPTPPPAAPKPPPPWCGRISIPALTASDRTALIDQFVKRNPGTPSGGGDGGPHIDSTGYFLSHSGLIQPTGGGGAPATASAAEQQALELLRKNADLLGFTEAELSAAKVTTKEERPGTLLAWRVSLSGSFPRKGYEAFPTVAKQMRIHVAIQKGGAMSLSNVGSDLPSFKLCTAAPLSPQSPAIVDAIVGQELSYSGFAGGVQSAGRVERQDIGPIEKTILVEHSNTAPRDVTLNLAYAVTVRKNSLSWTAFVDAKSGWLLSLRPNFVT